MAIILFKIATLVIKTIAKPIISWATYYNRMKLQEPGDKYKFVKNKIVYVGQITNYYNTKINRRLFRLSTIDPIKNLPEEKAIEKGAEVLSEFLIYTILISLPVMEWLRQKRITRYKEYIRKQSLRRIKSDIECVVRNNESLSREIKELKFMLEEINKKI